MNIKLYRSEIDGEVIAPPSKSVTHRALILAALAKGESRLEKILVADDTLCTIAALEALGVKIHREDGVDRLRVVGTEGRLKAPEMPIFLGMSGTTMRLLTAVAALVVGTAVLTGKKRLCERPIGELGEAIIKLGVNIEYLEKEGFPPIKIHGGKILGGKVCVPGSISSQYISALLLISPFAQDEMTIEIIDQLRSTPYVALTIDLMKEFGVQVRNQSFQSFTTPKSQRYRARDYRVEGDYSSASYLFAAAAVAEGKVTVSGLNPKSVQGDKVFLDILREMGCQVTQKDNTITVKGCFCLKGVTVDMGDYPDIVQTLAVVAANASGVTQMKNIKHLRYKETNRIKAIVQELSKMGTRVETDGESLKIEGNRGKGLQGSEIETYNDHRMAMSFAVAGLVADGSTIINNAEVVNKSYPDFFEDLRQIGARLERNEFSQKI